MKKEISTKFVIILLVLAIIFSIGGTVIVYDSVKSNEDNNLPGIGFVTLEVAEEIEKIEGVENEVFE
jgi:cytochrome c biogenesis protein ResB